MNNKRKSYISSCEISVVESVNLGGYPQKIAIEGKSKTSPVVICLDNENVTCTVLPNMRHFPSETAMKEINETINFLALSS